MKLHDIIKEQVTVSTDLSDKIVVHMAICPECDWACMSYNEDLSFITLAEHMKSDHREQLLSLIKSFNNMDQILIDLLIDSPRKFYKQLLKSQVSPYAVRSKDWLQMPDIVFN